MPEVDLAWNVRNGLAIAEVKSLTLENEVTQLRLGLGQLLHYRYLLGNEPGPALCALVLERAPTDASWLGLTASLGIVLTWPDHFGPILLGCLPLGG
jgi:hypothetical protein